VGAVTLTADMQRWLGLSRFAPITRMAS